MLIILPNFLRSRKRRIAEAIARRNLYEEVTDRIQHMILRGPLRPGDRLPTEQQLADQFGVSRTAIREAVKALVERGIVRVRQGQGTFVAVPTTDRASEFLTLLLQLTNRNISELLEARRAIELAQRDFCVTRRFCGPCSGATPMRLVPP